MERIPTDLPGHELVSAGLSDLSAGRHTESALLVAMAAPRLRSAHIEVPDYPGADPDHQLYELLGERDPTAAHSRYNALVRQLVSFCRAIEHAPPG